MAWKQVTGDERILPGGGGGMVPEVKLEPGKPVKVRLLLQPGEEAYGFFQHALENDVPGQDGGLKHEFRSVNCPKTEKNPNDYCPLCDGQRFRKRPQFVARVYDFSTGEVRYLRGGQDMWKPVATLAMSGLVNVAQMDWLVSRTGTGRNDTTYSMVNLPMDPNVAIPAYDPKPLDEVYAPHSIEFMQQMCQQIGIDWNTAVTPPDLKYPANLQEALNHVMPNGKYKQQTMGTIFQTQKGYLEFLAGPSDRMTPEKAMAQVILVALAGAQIEGVPNFANGGQTTSASASTTQTQASTQAQAQQSNPPAAGNTGTDNRKPKVDEINKLITSGVTSKKLQGADVTALLKQAGNGKTTVTSFTEPELDSMIKLLNDKIGPQT